MVVKNRKPAAAAETAASVGGAAGGSAVPRGLEGVYNCWIEPHLEALMPYIRAAVPIIESIVKKMQAIYLQYIKPNWHDGLGDFCFAVLLLFFGGQFALTILAWGAFQQAGGGMIKRAWKELNTEYVDSMRKLQEDPEAKALFDQDKDGEVSIGEVATAVSSVIGADTPEEKQKARRMIGATMRCVDPNRLLDAITGFWAGLVAVIAALRSQLAACVSVGASIGQKGAEYAKDYLEKPLYEKFPDYKDWVDAGLRAGCSLIGILVSLFMARIVTAFNCAIKGAQKLAGIAIKKAHEAGYLTNVKDNGSKVQALAMGLTAVGLWYQFSSGFSCPTLLKLVLFPLLISENILTLIAAM
ncbi:hypothetical protein FOL47_005300 [Perkinsus chesapeaki]|uniref:EF-hand domain-containing protein n=1 Tax=Perkinsus chesapeaki TaxID=330153 RepID=A0A7J6LXX0_PERCH|nr:hypothetical protein FOL47_005300 [Perkinsus chesapeaki]